MSSDYGLNFGFRRSDETVRVAEGMFKTPATGAVLLQGTAVQIDPTNPGYLTVCPANAPLIPGYAGILTQDEQWHPSIYDNQVLDSVYRGLTKQNFLSVISTGPGTKVWFENTVTTTRLDGHVVPGVTMYNPTGIVVGAWLGWTGTQWAVTTVAAQAWMTITAGLVGTTPKIEAVFLT